MDLSNCCWAGAALDGHSTGRGDQTLDLRRLEFLDEQLRPFVETAKERGIRAVLSIAVLAEPSKPVGALNLYSRAPGAFPVVEVPKAQVLAIRAARIFNPATQ